MHPEVHRYAMDFHALNGSHQLFNLPSYQCIAMFCVSSLGGAFAIFASLIYMVLKGNANKEYDQHSNLFRLDFLY